MGDLPIYTKLMSIKDAEKIFPKETPMSTDPRDVHDNSDAPDYAGLTWGQVLMKHHKLRGSDDLRYPPNSHRCRLHCGLEDMRDGVRVQSHSCFLRLGHTEPCEYSSECGMSRFSGSKAQ